MLEARRAAAPGSSYVAGLFHKGDDAILKKIGEEAAETLIAAKNGEGPALVHEVADLWFHVMVLLVHRGLGVEAVFQELERRFGRSGLEEKASRPQQE